MEMVSATATRRDVFAMSPTGLAAIAASDMTLRIPVAARDLALGLPALWQAPQCARREDGGEGRGHAERDVVVNMVVCFILCAQYLGARACTQSDCDEARIRTVPSAPPNPTHFS